MLDPVDVDPLRSIVDPVENAIISGPETIAVIPRQLQTSGRTSVLGQGADFLEDTFEGQSLEFVEVLLRRGKNEEVIHGAY